MLEGYFGEAQQLAQHGGVEVPLPEDCPDALLILMQLVHGQVKLVPVKLDPWLLAEIAILVDKYDLHGVSTMAVHCWFRGVTSFDQPTMDSDLIRLICSLWLFQSPNDLQKATKKFIEHSKWPVRNINSLPIPEAVFGMYCIDNETPQRLSPAERINDSRLKSIREHFDVMDALLDRFSSDVIETCNNGEAICDILQTGNLSWNLCRAKLSPRPAPPFNGLSIVEMHARFKAFGFHRTPATLSVAHQYCEKMEPTFKKRVKEVRAQVVGLDYSQHFKT